MTWANFGWSVFSALLGAALSAALSIPVALYFYNRATKDLVNEAANLRAETMKVRHLQELTVLALSHAQNGGSFEFKKDARGEYQVALASTGRAGSRGGA